MKSRMGLGTAMTIVAVDLGAALAISVWLHRRRKAGERDEARGR